MPLSDLKPFAEALGYQENKTLFPTGFSTQQLRQIESAFRRQSTFSARLDLAQTVARIREITQELINPVTAERDDGSRYTKGMDQSTAILELKKSLESEGYMPDEDLHGTLLDHSSFARRKLIVKTNVEIAQGVGNHIQSNNPDVIDAYPAQELVRFEARKTERDWQSRWRVAASSSGDTDALRVLAESGRMVARKDSPVWDELGSSDLFDDGLDNPFPPFAFGSGMWVQDVSAEEAQDLGLNVSGVEPKPLDFSPDFTLPDSLKDADVREILIDEDFAGDMDIDLSGPANIPNRALAPGEIVNRLIGVCHAIKNYSPDQQRDEFGKWVDENGGGLSVRDNIKRGKRVVQYVAKNQRDVQKGMYRKELGVITIPWGNPGTKKLGHVDGGGVSKMLIKHPRELKDLPVTLAKGRIIPHDRSPEKRYVIHKNNLAVISRVNKTKAWAITHFEDRNKIRELEQKRQPR